MHRRCLILCRVIDNFGDAGVCWRLARHLSERGWHVELVADQPDIVRKMVDVSDKPTIHAWPGPEVSDRFDVLLCAFGCDLPAAWREQMRQPGAPIWVHLDYLSAEPWVDQHHAMVSFKPDGARCIFVFPGFTPATGGLLHSASERQAFDRWRAMPGARGQWLTQTCMASDLVEQPWISLFCYPGRALERWVDCQRFRAGITWVAGGTPLAIDGVALNAAPGASVTAGRHRWVRLPWLSQADYDHLLALCDLNIVRGEDSWVRAQLAGRAFLWQPYRQAERTHVIKAEAFIALVARSLPEPVLTPWRAAMAAWADDESLDRAAFEHAWWLERASCEPAFSQWADLLWAQSSLAERLETILAAQGLGIIEG